MPNKKSVIPIIVILVIVIIVILVFMLLTYTGFFKRNSSGESFPNWSISDINKEDPLADRDDPTSLPLLRVGNISGTSGESLENPNYGYFRRQCSKEGLYYYPHINSAIMYNGVLYISITNQEIMGIYMLQSNSIWKKMYTIPEVTDMYYDDFLYIVAHGNIYRQEGSKLIKYNDSGKMFAGDSLSGNLLQLDGCNNLFLNGTPVSTISKPRSDAPAYVKYINSERYIFCSISDKGNFGYTLSNPETFHDIYIKALSSDKQGIYSFIDTFGIISYVNPNGTFIFGASVQTEGYTPILAMDSRRIYVISTPSEEDSITIFEVIGSRRI